tara:strand:+ start:14 stop:628 length:615 start_codon:yes stop_codon:yes gene_type:complete
MTKAGVAFDLLKGGAKAGDEILSGSGKSIDEIAEVLGKSTDDITTSTGKVDLPAGYQARGADGKLISKKGNRYYDEWDESWELVDVNKLKAIQATKNIDWAKKLDISQWGLSRFIPGAKTTFNLGAVAVVGGISWAILTTVTAFSDGLTETINNFFGLGEDCDSECEESGARNQLLLGTAIMGIGVISLASFLGLGKKNKSEDA